MNFPFNVIFRPPLERMKVNKDRREKNTDYFLTIRNNGVMKETTIMFEKGYKKAKRERMGTCESKKKRQKIKMKIKVWEQRVSFEEGYHHHIEFLIRRKTVKGQENLTYKNDKK